THYADPSGLLSENVSSAYDIARLITLSSQDERISSIMRMSEYTVYVNGKRPLTFHSTNHLLGRSDVDVRAGKTGFISKAGYCLATVLRPPETSQEVAGVVTAAVSGRGALRGSYALMYRRHTAHAATRYRPSRVANEVISARLSLVQKGHVSPGNGHCARQRPQMSRRSAFGVITAKSG